MRLWGKHPHPRPPEGGAPGGQSRVGRGLVSEVIESVLGWELGRAQVDVGGRLDARCRFVCGMAGKKLPECGGGGDRATVHSGGVGGGRAVEEKGVTRCLPKCNPRNTGSLPFPLEGVPGQVSLRNTVKGVHRTPQGAEGAWPQGCPDLLTGSRAGLGPSPQGGRRVDHVGEIQFRGAGRVRGRSVPCPQAPPARCPGHVSAPERGANGRTGLSPFPQAGRGPAGASEQPRPPGPPAPSSAASAPRPLTFLSLNSTFSPS